MAQRILAWLTPIFSVISGTLMVVAIIGAAKLINVIEYKSEALVTEVTFLRDTVMSDHHEDLIYLKIIILEPKIDLMLAREISGHVYKYSRHYTVDPDLILGIMEVESNFKPNAVSLVGAIGIMQVLPQWKKAWNIEEDLLTLETNIKYGIKIYVTYNEMWSDRELALTCYNRGPGPVEGALRNGTDPRNGYAEKVLKVYDRLKEISSTR